MSERKKQRLMYTSNVVGGRKPRPLLFGWKDDPKAVKAVLNTMPWPQFTGSQPDPLKGTGKGQFVSLVTPLVQARGKFTCRTQRYGTCVSQGYALGCEALMAAEVATGTENEEYAGDVATEPIYGGSRVEVGKGGCGNQDGSLGAWAQKWIRDWGVLLRKVYSEHDLTNPDEDLARQWGAPNAGVPNDLEPLARQHPIKTTTLVKNFTQLHDGICSGYPAPPCSDQGFTMKRDKQGFCRPEGEWPHCMCFLASWDFGPRPGALCCNSWGDYLGGDMQVEVAPGVVLYIPIGAFCVDAEVVDRMVKKGDTFRLSSFDGYPKRSLNTMPW